MASSAISAHQTALAQASMRRVLGKLSFETHPIFDNPCCILEHQGEFLHVKEDEVQDIAKVALSDVVTAGLFREMSDVRLDLICRDRLAAAASIHQYGN